MTRIAVMFASAVLLPTVAGCSMMSQAFDMSKSCADFQKATYSEQEKMATSWISSNESDLTSNVMFQRMEATEQTGYVVTTLAEWCSENPEDSLGDLTPGYAFGT